MTLEIDVLMNDALDKTRAAIELHKGGANAALSLPMLEKIYAELEKMRSVSDPKLFKPNYPRFLLDWPDNTGLKILLMNVAYKYGKMPSK